MVRDFDSPTVRDLRQSRPLAVLIVPVRVEQRDDTLRKTSTERFDKAFSAYLPEPFRQVGLSFLDLMIPYEPEFAFEERVLTDPAWVSERKRIGAAFQKLVDAISLLAPPGSNARVSMRRRSPTYERQSLVASGRYSKPRWTLELP
jgi:hypothetical protein